MRFPTLIVCVVALATAQQLRAQEPRPGAGSYLGATIGNNVLQLRYLGPSPVNPTGTSTDLDYGLLLSEERDIIGSAALMFRTDLPLVPGLTLAVGPQAYVALLNAPQKTDVAAVAFGASARYDIEQWGFAVFGSAFYSPSVLTFGNANNLYDFLAGAEMNFTPRLAGQAGYRWLKFTLVGEPNDRVANEVFAGLRWKMD
jgi:YfaZ precursor